MRVLVFAADESRCGHRLIWPARQLAAEGYDVVLNVPGWSQGGYDDLEGEVDVVVLQRPMHVRLLDAIGRFQKGGAAVVVELDDDMQNLSPRHVLWPAIQPKYSPALNWRVLREACARADLVTVSTPALADRYGLPGRVAVIPNHIPASYLDVERIPHDGLWVGWSGTVATHPNDLQVTRGAVAKAVGAAGAEVVVIGPEKGVQAALSLPSEPWPFGWMRLPWYPVGMAQVDVGIVPLEATPFNEAKSYLKGLEFAALGVPFVASATGPYRWLAERCGQVAAKPRGWEQHLRRLLASATVRDEQAAQGRDWAKGQTIERNAGMWMEAWERAVTMRRRQPVRVLERVI